MSSSRKQQHVELAQNANVGFRAKTTGLESVEIPYCALPEIDFGQVDTSTEFLGKALSMPLMITGMTGGYPDAARINAGLAEACARIGIGLGVGSMRSALDPKADTSTFTVVRDVCRVVPIVANIGAVQLVEEHREGRLQETLERLTDLVGASGIAIHLNPLQELMQPEGQPRFSDVLSAIAEAVRLSSVSVIVKEVGAGISGRVADSLAGAGVQIIDVAGAGGTSWAGVEILRRTDAEDVDEYWDVGIPTAECIRQCRGKVPTLIASGGINSGTAMAKALALGASMVGTARPALQAFASEGTNGLVSLLQNWNTDLRRWMFLSGSPTIHAFAQVLHQTDR